MFWHLKEPFWLGSENAPPRANPFLGKQRPRWGQALMDRLTNPDPYFPYGAHTPRGNIPALVTPGPGTRQLETTPIAQSPPQLYSLANPMFFYLTLPLLQNSSIGCEPSWPLVSFPCSPSCAMPPAPGICAYNKLCFSEASHRLLLYLYLTDLPIKKKKKKSQSKCW